MLQESGAIGLDPISIDRSMWIGHKIYVWFTLAAFGWAGARIIRVWLRVLRFSPKTRQPPDPDNLKNWRVLARSAARWSGLVLIGWALVAAIGLCRMALDYAHFANHTPVVFSVVGDLAGLLAVALFVVLVLYLIRWHLLLRIERHEG